MKILATFSCYYRKRLATFSCYCCCCSCCFCCGCRARLDKRLPDGKTPWHGRTEKVQNCAKKLPNVTSATGRKCRFWLQFPATTGSGWLLFPATAAVAPAASAVAAGHGSTSGCRTGKHHGTEGRRRFKIAPKNCLTSFLKS